MSSLGAGVLITKQEAQDTVTGESESHNPRPGPSPISSTPHPQAANRNAGLSNVIARSNKFLPGIMTEQDAQDIAIREVHNATEMPPMVPGSNANQLTISPNPHAKGAALGEVLSLDTSREVPKMNAVEGFGFAEERRSSASDVTQEEMSCDTPLTNAVRVDEAFGMEGLNVFDDEFDAQLEGDPDSGFHGQVGTQGNDSRGAADETLEVDSSHTVVPSESEGETSLAPTLPPRHPDRPTSCVYKDFVCCCIADDHHYDSSLPSISVAHVDETCEILRS